MQTMSFKWTPSKCEVLHFDIENLTFLSIFVFIFHVEQNVVKITTQTSSDTSWFGLAKYAWAGSGR